VNPTAEEGDLTRLSAGEFRDAFSVSGLTWIEPQQPIEELSASLHTITEIAPWLLGLLLGILSMETFFAWRFGRRREEAA
jgi:hypothetical protein